MAESDSEGRIVVTGASGRLGRVLVNTFVEAGLSVTAIDSELPQGEALPASVGFIEADLTDEASVEHAFAALAEHPPDALVHAVGMWGETPMESTSLADFRTMVDVNLTSTFLCFREALRVMKTPGSLVAFASGQGADGASPRQAAYSAAKAGVIRLVEATDLENRERGIRAFAVAPSMILFGEDEGEGVRDFELARLCLYLTSDAGRTLSGGVIRAYG